MFNSLARSFKKLVSKDHAIVLPQPQGIITNKKLCEITKRRLKKSEAGIILLGCFNIGGTYELYCAMMINSDMNVHDIVCRYEFGYTYNLLDMGK